MFGPAWTTLYILMAYAFYRVLRLEPATPGRRAAIIVFFAQLVLNAAWSFAFFYARSPQLGLVVILPMAALLVATIVLFWRLDRVAGYFACANRILGGLRDLSQRRDFRPQFLEWR